MADGIALAYRQWRLERKMFWRNPSAALARGERLRDLSVTRPTLEDVYLELTAEAVAAGDETAAEAEEATAGG